MGFLDFFKSEPSDDEEAENMLTIRVDQPWELMKVATDYHRKGEIDRAVAILEKAYPLMEQYGEPPSLQDRLKLPKYLRDTGEFDKAWAELNRLVKDWKSHPDTIFMDYSVIYKAMRIQLVKEKKFTEAIRYALMSRFCWGVGLCRQERWRELEDYHLDRNVKNEFSRLLKKSGREALLDNLMEVYCAHLQLLPETGLPQMVRAVDVVLSPKKN